MKYTYKTTEFLIKNATLAALIVLALFPIYWMLNTSFKSDGEIYRMIPTFLPASPTFTAYANLFTKTPFITYLLNSVFVSTVVTAASLFVSMLGAYAIARLDFKAAVVFAQAIFYAYLIPKTVMYIPLYMVNVKLDINDSLLGLILIYPTFVIPYATWMLIAYFKTIPKELEEVASVDGAGRWRVMFQIIFPVAKPGIMATVILAFTLCWSEYLYAMVNISSTNLKTLPVGLTDLITDDIFAWGKLAAGAVFASLPIAILYVISNRYIEGGAVAGAVKG